MTSDKTEANATPSLAKIHLDYALGRHRVALADLKPEEFDQFLFWQLDAVLLRELRGFSQLRDVLSTRGEDSMTVANDATFRLHRLEEQSDEIINLRTQAIKVCRGVCAQHLLFRRTESETTTTSPKIAAMWGTSAYVHSGQTQILVLTRPSKNCQADRNLFAIEYRFAKVPHERKYLIHTVNATQIPAREFRSYFGNRASEIARDLMWAIRDLHTSTLHELVSQTGRMREELGRWERLTDSIRTN